MSLINYVESTQPFNAGGFFIGVAFLIFVFGMCWFVYRLYDKLMRYLDMQWVTSAKYHMIEEAFLDKIAKENGIDLDKGLVKNKLLQGSRNKSFKRKLEEQIYEEMFGKDEPKDK